MTIELKTYFVYGTDYGRGMYSQAIPLSTQIAVGLMLLFICLAAISLSIIRRKLKLRGDDFYKSFIDCLIPLVGGGNIRMRHKYERWFFGVSYFAAFLLVNIFASDFVNAIITIFDSKISTFEQLAQTNSPIYIHEPLRFHSDEIHGMLQYVEQKFTQLPKKVHIF